MTAPASATISERARARLLSPGLIQIKCVGHLVAEDADYLPKLGRFDSDTERGQVCIVFEAMTLESYSPKFPLAHIEFFRNYQARLNRSQWRTSSS